MLRLRDISKTFIVDEEDIRFFEALKAINITLTKKEFVVILGKSGSGKSTLLNIISGIDSFDNGTYYYFENRVNKFEEAHFDYFRSKKCGMVFQNYYLMDHLNVLENIMVAQSFGFNKKTNMEDAKKALQDVGLYGFENKYPHQLSSGERQRVAIARSIVNHPLMIIADEPTGNLDSVTSKEILDLFKKLSKERLVLMVTHDEDAAVVYADRVIQIDEGKVILDYKVTEAQNNLEDTEVIFKKRVNPIASFVYGINQIYIYKWRLLLSILLFAISLSFIGGTIFYQDGYRQTVLNIVEDLQNTKALRVESNSVPLTGLDFDDAVIALKNRFGADAFISKLHLLDLYIVQINGQDLQTRININEIQPYVPNNSIDSFELFKDGRYPSNDNEIVLSYKDALKLVRTDDLNQAWSLLKDANLQVPFEVKRKYIYQNFVNEISMPIPKCTTYTWNQVDPPVNFTNYGFGDFLSYQLLIQDLFGVDGLIYQGDQYFVCDTDFLVENSIPTPFNLITSPMIISTQNIKVVGIIANSYQKYSYLNYNTMLLMENKNHMIDETLYQVYYQENVINITGLNLHEIDFTTETLDNLIDNRSFKLQTTLVYILATLFGITVIISFSNQVHMQAVKERKSISILRSVGASKQDIKIIYITQGLILGIITIILFQALSWLIILVGNLWVNTITMEKSLNLFYRLPINLFIPNYIVLLVLSVVSIVVMVMVYYFIYKSYAKEKIINLIRNR